MRGAAAFLSWFAAPTSAMSACYDGCSSGRATLLKLAAKHPKILLDIALLPVTC